MRKEIRVAPFVKWFIRQAITRELAGKSAQDAFYAALVTFASGVRTRRLAAPTPLSDPFEIHSRAWAGSPYYWCMGQLLDARVHPRWVLSVLLLLLAGTVALGRLAVSTDMLGFVAAVAGIEAGAIIVIDVTFSRMWLASAVAVLLVIGLFIW